MVVVGGGGGGPAAGLQGGEPGQLWLEVACACAYDECLLNAATLRVGAEQSSAVRRPTLR